MLETVLLKRQITKIPESGLSQATAGRRPGVGKYHPLREGTRLASHAAEAEGMQQSLNRLGSGLFRWHSAPDSVSSHGARALRRRAWESELKPRCAVWLPFIGEALGWQISTPQSPALAIP